MSTKSEPRGTGRITGRDLVLKNSGLVSLSVLSFCACLSFYASPPDRLLTTDLACGIGPGGNADGAVVLRLTRRRRDSPAAWHGPNIKLRFRLGGSLKSLNVRQGHGHGHGHGGRSRLLGLGYRATRPGITAPHWHAGSARQGEAVQDCHATDTQAQAGRPVKVTSDSDSESEFKSNWKSSLSGTGSGLGPCRSGPGQRLAESRSSRSP